MFLFVSAAFITTIQQPNPNPTSFKRRSRHQKCMFSSRVDDINDISSCRQFFANFNEQTNARVRQADQVQDVTTEFGHSLSVWLCPLDDDNGILSIDDNLGQYGYLHQNKEFVDQFVANGGFAVLRLSEAEAKATSNMWRITKKAFDEVDRTKNAVSQDVRFQKLVRNNAKENTENVGYNYIEISHDDKSLDALQRIVGDKFASQLALESLELLSSLGTRIAAKVVAELTQLSHGKAASLVAHSLIGALDDKQNICFQRLARYMQADADKEETENLASHCDWSIFTIVPVSDEPGLQVFNAESQVWVAPEAAIRQLAKDTSNCVALSESYNSRYVIVMTGKWLELLTNGKIKSTIHRVVSPRRTSRRFSTPFFLRLKLDVVEAVESVDLAQPNDIVSSTLDMSRFLQRLGDSAQ